MGFFQRKPKNELAQKEISPKVGFIARKARDLAMITVKRSIQSIYDDHRLVFKPTEQLEYTEKDGSKQLYSIDELSAHLWSKMDAQSSQKTGQPAFSVLDIKPDDVKEIILKLLQRGRKEIK